MRTIPYILSAAALAAPAAWAKDARPPREPPLVLQVRAHLPDGWTCTVVKEKGKMGHPHGLEEPLFRADFTNARQTFPFPSRKDRPKTVHPRIPLYFYPIRSKGDVMEVIHKERVYSWDIPIYFGETGDYLVVTSPAYVNHGVFTEEAKKGIRPMWTVLRKHIKNKEGTNVDELAQPGK